MLNARGRHLYRTAFSPGKSRLVPAPSLPEAPETPEEASPAEMPDPSEEEKTPLDEPQNVAKRGSFHVKTFEKLEDTSEKEKTPLDELDDALQQEGETSPSEADNPSEEERTPSAEIENMVEEEEEEKTPLDEPQDSMEEDSSFADASEEAIDLAEIETHKTPSLALDAQEASDLVDAETRKTPSVALDPLEEEDLTDVVTSKVPVITRDLSEADDLADIETRKTPSVALDPLEDDDLGNVEPRKTPSVSLDVGTVSDLADEVTDKTPSLAPESEDASAIVDLETRKTPSVAPGEGEQELNQPAPSLVIKHKRHRYLALSKPMQVLLLFLVCMLLLPTFVIVFEAVNAFVLYKQMQDGLTHLQNAQELFRSGPTGNPARYFDTRKLREARIEINAAHADFVSLSFKLDHSDALVLATHFMSARISTLRALGHMAVTGTAAAQQFIATAIVVAPSVAPALQLASAQADTLPIKPYITPSTFQKIADTLDGIAPLIHEMNVEVRNVELNTLPISEKQHQTLAALLMLLPVLETGLAQSRALKSELRWLLGIDGQRAFLIEPMDRAELRATGGFTGQFGDLLLNGAHMGPLKLSNIGKYEEDHTIEGSPPDKTVYPKVIGQNAPANYLNWWPVANFGLRDANLSADFPTSARIAMERYNYEFDKKVDGVLMFTPTLIKQILHVTGPLFISSYNEQITEYNLEDRLHYYQLDNKGIRHEEIVEHVEDTQIARKLFTQKVTAALFSKVTHLSFDKLLPMAKEMLQSMKSKDLQIYVTNPQLEALIGRYGSTAALDRSTSHDGLFIVQSNLSASKASQYVATSVQDAIILDKKGGATHHLQVTLDYQQKGDVYGFDTYRDYIRVYVPVSSRFLEGNGFDQYATPYCGDAQSRYSLCLPNVYGDGSLVCAAPVTMGYATTYLHDPYAGRDHPLDRVGPPQNQQSDEAGRAMFGGWVVIPKNCTMKVTLSWYVPPMGQHAYSLLLQAQAGVPTRLNLTIHPSAGTCISSKNAQNFVGSMDGRDTTFTLQAHRPQCALTAQ